jgi:hypothetical protein
MDELFIKVIDKPEEVLPFLNTVARTPGSR